MMMMSDDDMRLMRAHTAAGSYAYEYTYLIVRVLV